MKRWSSIIPFFMLLLFGGCNGCVNKFYAVHEKVDFLNVLFLNSNVNASSMLDTFDNLATHYNNKYEILKHVSGLTLNKDDRIVHFKSNPDESYWVSIDANPCRIVGVQNNNIDSSDWIFERYKISDSELDRISKRFINEILAKIDSPTSFRVRVSPDLALIFSSPK